jgi:hypothetical protein
MRTRALIACCVALLPAAGLAQSRDKECQVWTQQAIDNPAVGCEAACSQAGRFDNFQYHSALVAAHASRSELEQFVAYTARSTITGAGAEEQACHLYSLLLKWGDQQFAAAVSKAGKKAKERIVGLLDYAAVTKFKKRFPTTYGLVSKHEE